jgi:hypothetical protein
LTDSFLTNRWAVVRPSLTRDRPYEIQLALHHAGVSDGSAIDWSRFYHRTYVFENAESKRVRAVSSAVHPDAPLSSKYF